LRRGDIYFVSLDPTFGREQRGTRPVIVVSPDDFNQLTQLPLVLPVTNGGGFARQHGFAVSLHGAGTKTTGIVRCDQPRVADLQARNARFVERLSGPLLDEIVERTHRIFG
jgi:mRNA-degrading endonuclease toxin of MazEF toxin-antitoxin module